ncbi:MAG: hypothetical protein FH753_15670 [Firmicutes bacterium]|nr:hypothetical protein [Bacillota bacterium]
MDIIDFEENTNIKISDGTAIKVKLIPFVLKSILKIKKERLSEKEILLISNDTEDIIRLTLNLAKESKFITILSDNQNFFSALEKKVLLDTGLVVHVIKNIKNINKYDIIINFKDILISKNEIKGRKIIFDLTRGRNKHIEFIRKDLFIANDFLLKNPKKVICDNKNFSFNNTINTGLYNLLYDDVSLLLTHVLIKNNRYTLKDACDLFLNKGLIRSNFLKKP